MPRKLSRCEIDCLKYKGMCFCDPISTRKPRACMPCTVVYLPPCGPEERERRLKRRAEILAEKAPVAVVQAVVKPCWPGIRGPMRGRRT